MNIKLFLMAINSKSFTRKQLINDLQSLDLEQGQITQVLREFKLECRELYCGNYRFINREIIDEILGEELQSDLYVLGCFYADFISSQTNLPIEMIKACQKADAFQAIGKGIIATCGINKFAKAYKEADGYGHHFAHYDGECNEVGSYYAFRVS